MTISIRYVRQKAPYTDFNFSSDGFDDQLVAFDITTVNGIAQGENADILTWTGVGGMRFFKSIFVRVPRTGEVIPVSLDGTGTTGTLLTTTNRRTVNIEIGANGIAIPPNSVISLLLVIGFTDPSRPSLGSREESHTML